MCSAFFRRHSTTLFAVVAVSPIFIGGCPPENETESSSTPATGPAVLLDGLDTGPEGLSIEAADAIATNSTPIPTDRSQVILLGGGALNAFREGATAKVRDRSAGNPDCAKDQVAALLNFQELLALNGIAISEFDEPLPAGPGDAALNPAQPNGLAYVFGSADPQVRAAGEPPAVCQLQLFGLDCSGFVGLCARESGVPVTEWARSSNINDPGYWNQKIPREWGVTMVRVPFETPDPQDPRTWTRLFTGDITAFNNHTGFIVQTPAGPMIWNSAGSPDYTCTENMHEKRGPTAWPVANLLDLNAEGKRIYPTLRYVLRLIPKCALEALSTGRDDPIGLLIEVDLLKQQRDADAVALAQAYIACGNVEPQNQAACAENVLLSFKDRICDRANQIACLTYRAALLELQSDTLADLISTSRTFSNITFRDGSHCACALN